MGENIPTINVAPVEEPHGKPIREYISMGIIFLSGGIVLLLIVVACNNLPKTKEDASFAAIKELLGLVLPLVGTWMGTVLAYYFSKNNFEAANRSINAMARQVIGAEQKLQELKVSDVMIKPSFSQVLLMENMEAFENYKLMDLVKVMTESHSERLPILQKDSLKFLFLIYRSTIDRFLSDYDSGLIKLNDGSKPDRANLIMKNIFQSDFKLFKEISCTTHNIFISNSATLAEARQIMLDNSICQDVFITKTGNKDEPVEGWVTNTMVIEKSELFKKAGT